MPLATADRLLQNLPAIYREDPYLGQFLAPFEEILLGDPKDSAARGLEQTIARLSTYFDPQATPAEFLDWLGGWVALTLYQEFDEVSKRDFIARAVTLFRGRGTIKAVASAIQVYTRLAPTITEFHHPARPDVYRPHYFHVLLRIAESDPARRKRYVDVATQIIDAEKPAHTYYELDVETPAMQIAVHSTIGVDTLLSPPKL